MDLRKYLQQNKKTTWKEKIQITFNIISALNKIHGEKAIHRDLHSGNILYLQYNNGFYISDLGFCGPADKPSEKIYGNLPYIAPEVLIEKEHTFKSDIYSVGILMWEISSGQPPFINYEHDYYLAMNIVNGIRPKILPGTPLRYKSLMEQCWDADPSKRPDVFTLLCERQEINMSYYYQDTSNENKNIPNNLEINKTNNLEIYCTNSKLSTSKVYQFEDLPEPRNATEGNNIT